MELLVVLAILGLAVAVTAPRLTQSVASRELDAIARSIAASLRETRLEAVSSNRAVAVTIDLEKHRISGPAIATLDLPENLSITVLTASSEVRYGTAGFRFHPNGSATGGRIVLRGADQARELAINWLSGSVTVSRAGGF